MTVLAQISVLVASLSQRVDHGGFLDPAAHDHCPHTEGNRVQPIVAASFRGASKLGCAAIQCGARIFLLPFAIKLVEFIYSGWRPRQLPVLLVSQPTMLTHAVGAVGDILGGQCCIDVRQSIAYHAARFAALPGVVSSCVGVLAEHDNLLAIPEHLDMMFASIR